MTTPAATTPRPRKSGGIKRLIFSLILLGMIVGSLAIVFRIAELRAAQIIANNTDYVHARKIMGNTAKGEGRYIQDPEQKVIAQPYLLYIPSPGNKDMGHNEHGYRGPIIPVERVPDVARVLFIGGSTTYGWGVQKAEDTYPLRLREALMENLPPNIKDVEVINAGLPFGTSAEHLTHYLLKFRYYHPDLVVIDCGGNDAGVDQIAFYHPDYSHWRQELATVKPLPPKYQWVMKSSILSLFVIECMQLDFVQRQGFIREDQHTPPLAPWFVEREAKLRSSAGMPDEYLAFYNNIRALMREAKADGSKLMVVPFIPNRNNIPGYGYDKEYLGYIRRNRDILRRLAEEFEAPFVPIENNDLPRIGWSDPFCHLNIDGEKAKGRFLAPHVREILAGITPRSEPTLSPIPVIEETPVPPPKE